MNQNEKFKFDTAVDKSVYRYNVGEKNQPVCILVVKWKQSIPTPYLK